MDAPINALYRSSRTLAPNIKVRLDLYIQDERRAVDAFDGGCLGLDLVRTDERHVVAVLKPGEALKLKR